MNFFTTELLEESFTKFEKTSTTKIFIYSNCFNKIDILDYYFQIKVFGKKQVRSKRPQARKMNDRKVEKEI